MPLVKPKAYPLLPPAVATSPLMQNLAVVMAINWMCQGMRGMGWKELSFRLALELLLATALAGAAAVAGLSRGPAAIAGVVGAHTLQFLFNGQLWVCMRYSPRWRPADDRSRRFVDRVVAELRRTDWLCEAVIIGSRATDPARARPGADIDLRLVFPAGMANWVRTNLLLLRLRARACVAAVPLDLYGYDRVEALLRHRSDEPVGVVLDRARRVATALASRRRLVPWP